MRTWFSLKGDDMPAEQKKIKIELCANTVCDGKHFKVGDVVDATEKNARYLIAIGKAVESVGKPAKADKKAEKDA